MLKDKIRAQRKTLHMSQEELAEAVGVSRQTIYKWENGQAQPDIENVKRLCNALHMTYEELLEDDQEIKPEQINYLNEGSNLVKKHWRKLGYLLLYWGVPAIFIGILMKSMFPVSPLEAFYKAGPLRLMWLIPNFALGSGVLLTLAGSFLIWKDYKINKTR